MYSYFVEVMRQDAYPQMILTGDRNIGIGGIIAAPHQTTFCFQCRLIGNQQHGPVNFAWTANDMHQKAGNLGLADGSVPQATGPA